MPVKKEKKPRGGGNGGAEERGEQLSGGTKR